MSNTAEIYEQYGNDVYRYLICLTKNEELSEELTQETFYQAVKSLKRFDGKCKMSVWLCQIAKHLYYDYIKKEKRRTYLGGDEYFDGEKSDDRVEDEVSSHEGTLELYRKIHSLEEPYREVFLLRVLTEMSFEDIGAVLGKSENWARVTFYRARLKLKEGIANEECV